MPSGTWTSSAPGANGTLYNIPMSAGNVPGAHDVVLSSAPPFVDATRNLQTWAVANGYAEPSDSLAVQKTKALAVIQANISLVSSSLIPWVREGFALTGSGSLVGTASDGFNRGYDPRATS